MNVVLTSVIKEVMAKIAAVAPTQSTSAAGKGVLIKVLYGVVMAGMNQNAAVCIQTMFGSPIAKETIIVELLLIMSKQASGSE